MRARTLRMSLACLMLQVLGAVLCGSRPNAAEVVAVPVARGTIYPGDLITDEGLVERALELGAATSRPAFALTRSDIVGKIARRTLLPGAPIPLNGVAAPRTVVKGAKVRILFSEGGVAITALGTAMQSGGVGDIVSVRNLDSGVTVSGAVQKDGSIRVGGG